jgi:hypothetical protein
MHGNRSLSKAVFFLPAFRTILFISSGLLFLAIPTNKGKNLNDVSMWWPLLCIGVNIITIIFLFLLTNYEGKKYRDLIHHIPDWKKTRKEILTATPIMLLLGIGGLVGFSWLIYGYMPVITTQPLPVWAAITVSILLPVTIVFSEIPFYLGYRTPRIKEITNSEVFSIVYPLFFYALQHSFMPLLFDFTYMVSRFVMFIPLLIMIGIWYSRKRDLLPLMAGHGLLDVFTGIQLLMVSILPSFYDMIKPSELAFNF